MTMQCKFLLFNKNTFNKNSMISNGLYNNKVCHSLDLFTIEKESFPTDRLYKPGTAC